MQQERSFLRRLCFCTFGFTSKKYNARRAYNLIPLAVKTSRPQFLWIAKIKLFISISIAISKINFNFKNQLQKSTSKINFKNQFQF